MIQGVISRVSGFSAAVKNFAVTVLVALAAFAFEKRATAPLWAATVALSAFLIMDGYYHLLEVRYRELHRTTAKKPIEEGSDMLLEAPKPTWANVRKVIISKTLLPFYVLLLFAMWFALEEVSDEHQANPTAVSHLASDPGHKAAAEYARRSP
jgi:uncharacterized membrane protein YbhN (UPF0104 family)